MPIVQHPACAEPETDVRVCRFMDFDKFRDLFASEELYFRRTDLFKETDPSEGLPPDAYVRAIRGLTKYDVNDERALNNDLAFARQNSEAYFISCWQLFAGETLEMWKRYGGIAVFTHYSFLKSAVAAMLDPIFLGVVKYGEKDMTGYNLIRFLYTKRRSFENERELRVVVQSCDPLASGNRNFDENNFAHREPLNELNPIHAWVHECKRRRIELSKLVTEVRLSPWATARDFDEVRTWVKVKNLSCAVNPSDLTSAFTPSPDELRKFGS